MNEKCQIENCEFTCETINELHAHILSHNMEIKDYVLKFKYGGIAPICKCLNNCGQETAWNKNTFDFNAYVHNHNSAKRIVDKSQPKSQHDLEAFYIKNCQLCGLQSNSLEFLFRHLKSHGITAENYILRFKYGNKQPICACNICMKPTTWNVSKRDFNEYIHGHQVRGREVSIETRKKIGSKNAHRSKQYFDENPDKAKERSELMREAITPEIEAKRLENTKKAYDAMTPEEKQKFSDHAKDLWENDREKMEEAAKRAGQTFHERYEAGEYDFEEKFKNNSRIMIEKHQKGDINYATGIYEAAHGTTVLGSHSIPYRSTDELVFCEYLDDCFEVEEWIYEFTELAYRKPGYTYDSAYLPDFLVKFKGYDRKVVVEVKPQWARKHPISILKREAAISYCKEEDYLYGEWEINDGDCQDFLSLLLEKLKLMAVTDELNKEIEIIQLSKEKLIESFANEEVKINNE